MQGADGQTQSVEFGTAYAFTKTLAPGHVYKYRFDTREIKEPIRDAVTSCGWTVREVVNGAADWGTFSEQTSSRTPVRGLIPKKLPIKPQPGGL